MDLTLDQKMTLILVIIGVITFILTIIKFFYPTFFVRWKATSAGKTRQESKKVKTIVDKEKKIKDKRRKRKGPKRLAIIERKVILEPGEYYVESLGELKKGDTVSGTCYESQNENFSYFIFNKMKKLNFETSGKIKEPVCYKKNRSKLNISCVIKNRDEYYLLFLHMATVKGRNIKFIIEVERE